MAPSSAVTTPWPARPSCPSIARACRQSPAPIRRQPRTAGQRLGAAGARHRRATPVTPAVTHCYPSCPAPTFRWSMWRVIPSPARSRQYRTSARPRSAMLRPGWPDLAGQCRRRSSRRADPADRLGSAVDHRRPPPASRRRWPWCPRPAPTAPAPAAAAPVANAAAYVQLASQRSEADARATVDPQMTTRYGSLFSGASLQIQRVDLGERGDLLPRSRPAASLAERRADLCPASRPMVTTAWPCRHVGAGRLAGITA